MALQPRPFRSEDFPALVRLSQEAWRLGGPHEYPPGQLCWELARLNPEDQAMLWETPAGELAGLCVAYLGSDIGGLVHPALGGRLLEHAMFEWAEGVFGEAPPVIACCERQPGRRQVLEQRGYTVQGPYIVVTQQSLERDLPPPAWPQRFLMGDLTTVSLEARVAAQRAAFERSRTTEETYLAVMATPVYVPELDVVAVGPEGEVTAFAIGWVDPVNRHAIFEPVGTHPDHRRKGLAKAVLLEGLRRMKRMGAITAQVGHLAGAEGPRRLYESVGFAPVDLWTRWEKPKPPGR